jgi:hypothetical protein
MHRGGLSGVDGGGDPPPGVRVGGGRILALPHTYHFLFPLPKFFWCFPSDQADLIQRCIGRIFFPFFFFFYWRKNSSPVYLYRDYIGTICRENYIEVYLYVDYIDTI